MSDEAKTEQGYQEQALSCKNCLYASVELIEYSDPADRAHQLGTTYPVNVCAIGRFEIDVEAVCSRHKKTRSVWGTAG